MNNRLQTKIFNQARLIQPLCHQDVKSQHISFIVYKNRIISIGINSYKTHPLSAKFRYYNNYVHSELNAIVNARNLVDVSDCSLYNLRIRRDNNKFDLSYPCKNCQNLIIAFNIKNVYFTNEFGKFDKMI